MSDLKRLDNGELEDLAHLDDSPAVAVACCDRSADRVFLANGRVFRMEDGCWVEDRPVPGTEAGSILGRILDGRVKEAL